MSLVWPVGLAKSFCKPSRGGTCHVRRAPLKSAKARVRRVGHPPIKFGTNTPNRFHARIRKPRQTDRQKERQRQWQKMPTYSPSLNLRNAKNLQMLKHINFPFSSYDFGQWYIWCIFSSLKMICDAMSYPLAVNICFAWKLGFEYRGARGQQ